MSIYFDVIQLVYMGTEDFIGCFVCLELIK